MNTMDMFSLNGKVAIVTGGYGLYGKHISLALCEAGAAVIIASRNKERCIQFANMLCSKGYQAEGMELDLSSEGSIISFVQAVIEEYKYIDILVNNSVLRTKHMDLEEVTEQELVEATKVNTIGLMQISREVVKHMKQRGEGNIINISSIQGAVGPNFTVYGDTGMSSPVNYSFEKWGMVGLTKWMANYYGKYNIRVNCISPGGYAEGDQDDNNEFVRNYRKYTPLCRFADDDDIKGPVVFLASEASRYVTGHNLLVDGGWTSW
jgi:NAD(P)-dependent dehydrogenase (short-subunit alcohol dehydrogenase family)